MTRNDCYTSGRKIKPTGIVVHSTATPGVMAAAWFSRWNKSFKAGETDRQVCAHMFIDDKEAWEYLPINPEKNEAHRSWLHGGTANNTHLGFEMCEPGGFTYKYPGAVQVGYDVEKNTPYFNAVYANAVEMCAKWCREFNIPVKNIIDHAEGARLGICSSSADVGHWFPKHGKSMNTLRADVQRALDGVGSQPIGGDRMVKVGTIINVTTNLRVRSTPSSTSTTNIVGTLNNGEQVPVIQEGTWNKIIFNDAVAYAHSEYMRVTELGTGSGTGITQAQLDAEKAKAAQEKARADSALASLASEQAKTKSLTAELKGVASNMNALDKLRSKYS